LKTTPLHEEHVALNARLVPFAGYEMPVQYAGVKAEHLAVRTAAGLFDVSHMGELVLSGPEAGDVVNRLITNDASKLDAGRALYTCCCGPDGGILDDLIVYRLAQDRWLVVCNASNRDKIVNHFRTTVTSAVQEGRACDLEDTSDSTALIALQGPQAMAIAARCGPDGAELAQLEPFQLRGARLCECACVAARTGYTGEDGLELFCPAADGAKLWRSLMAAGSSLGLQPAGLAARDTLRLEARLSLYGNDIDESTNPIEAGLGWTVKLDKADFVGKAALQAIKAEGRKRWLVGFEMVGRGIARQGYRLLDKEGEAIGVCTSGSPAPTVGKNIGLGYVPAGKHRIGTELVVDCRGRMVDAVIVKTPFYKRQQ